MKKFISIFLVLILMFTLVSCTKEPTVNSPKPTVEPTAEPAPTEPVDTKPAFNDGVIGEREPGGEGREFPEAIMEDAPALAEKTDSAYDGEGSFNYYQPGPGMLSAGEIKDLKDIVNWKSLFEDNSWKDYVPQRELYSHNVVKVQVKVENYPVINTVVKLNNSNNETVWTSVTDINGEAALFYKDTQSYTIQVDDVQKEFNPDTYNNETIEIEISDSKDIVKKLDLMLMVDTTGSMGDELEFLKEELVDMVNRISKSDDAFSIRVSVNFYRDEGDDYVVKYFDFRDDINECLKQIKEQYASGGGDYPEAVHTALDNAISGHEWREDAIKLCFFVLDAPPHTESEIQGINSSIIKSIQKASEIGVRIIPVASSGVDQETIYILRSFAIMTGGTYIFLTNDSGIGYSHEEPTDTEYEVEPLNECMIRVVCEYCGLKYEPIYTWDPSEYNVEPTEVPETDG